MIRNPPTNDNVLCPGGKGVEQLPQHWQKITESSLRRPVLAVVRFVAGQMVKGRAA